MLDLLTKNVLTQIVGVIFAIFATFHIVLPSTMTQPAIVGVVVLIVATVAAITRFGQPGQPFADAKVWYASKTIWVQIVAVVFALSAILGLKLPFDQDGIVGGVAIVIGLINLVLHGVTTQPLVATSAQAG